MLNIIIENNEIKIKDLPLLIFLYPIKVLNSLWRESITLFHKIKCRDGINHIEDGINNYSCQEQSLNLGYLAFHVNMLFYHRSQAQSQVSTITQKSMPLLVWVSIYEKTCFLYSSNARIRWKVLAYPTTDVKLGKIGHWVSSPPHKCKAFLGIALAPAA